MKEIIIAFDIDGTLLLQILAKSMKNTKVIVWSGGGKEYAEQIVRRYGLERYVHRCYGKTEYEAEIEGTVDIAFDDVHACTLGDKNLIVRMK